MKILQWILFNAAVLTAFLVGSMGGPEGFLYLSLFVLWLTAIGGTLLNNDKLLDMLPKDAKIPAPYWTSLVFDAATLVMIVFFGHWFLGLFYLAHMSGVYNTYNYFNRL